LSPSTYTTEDTLLAGYGTETSFREHVNPTNPQLFPFMIHPLQLTQLYLSHL